MKLELLKRIEQLGGNTQHISQTQCLKEQLQSIDFQYVVYQKPALTSWLDLEEQEPLIGLNEFISSQEKRLNTDCYGLYEDIIDYYYSPEGKNLGQMTWLGRLFTPFTPNTSDYEQWSSHFHTHGILPENLLNRVDDSIPEFIQIFHGNGYPDHYYICLSDPMPENPMVYSTDSESFFEMLNCEGYLHDFLNCCLTPQELIEMVKNRVELVEHDKALKTFSEFTHV